MGNQLWPGAVWSTHFRFLNLLARDLRGLANINLYFSFVNVWNRPETLASLLRWASWSKNSGVIWILRSHIQFYIWCALLFQLDIVSITPLVILGQVLTNLTLASGRESEGLSTWCARSQAIRFHRICGAFCLPQFSGTSGRHEIFQKKIYRKTILETINFHRKRVFCEVCKSTKKNLQKCFHGSVLS